jgi:hypothetical protein
MYLVQNLTEDALQTMDLVLPDGSDISLTIYYTLNQQAWFIQNLTYGSFVLQGFQIINSPNMLYQWQNVLPFGLACFSTNEREPSLIQDFLSGNSQLFVLTQAECQQYQEFLSGG